MGFCPSTVLLVADAHGIPNLRLEVIWVYHSRLAGKVAQTNLLYHTWKYPRYIQHSNETPTFSQWEICIMVNWLVVSTQLKNSSQNGNLPLVNIWKDHHLVNFPFRCWFANPACFPRVFQWSSGSKEKKSTMMEKASTGTLGSQNGPWSRLWHRTPLNQRRCTL